MSAAAIPEDSSIAITTIATIVPTPILVGFDPGVEVDVDVALVAVGEEVAVFDDVAEGIPVALVWSAVDVAMDVALDLAVVTEVCDDVALVVYNAISVS